MTDHAGDTPPVEPLHVDPRWAPPLQVDPASEFAVAQRAAVAARARYEAALTAVKVAREVLHASEHELSDASALYGSAAGAYLDATVALGNA
jgi:hypothetical protein